MLLLVHCEVLIKKKHCLYDKHIPVLFYALFWAAFELFCLGSIFVQFFFMKLVTPNQAAAFI